MLTEQSHPRLSFYGQWLLLSRRHSVMVEGPCYSVKWTRVVLISALPGRLSLSILKVLGYLRRHTG